MKAIFVTADDIKRYSVLDGNVDHDKYAQFIEIAQDIHVHTYLGTDLYDKIQSLIIANTIDDVGNAVYKTLLETYIKPMHIHYSLVEMFPYIAYTLKNGGFFKHGSETSESVSIEEIEKLAERSRSTAQWYTERMIDYLCDNSTSYPEYTSNSNGDVYPDKDSKYTGWVL